MIRKILIANRGEIAVRIIRACREMGIATVAVYSEADKNALHVKLADQAVCIGPAPSQKSYLNVKAILEACCLTGADSIHPGYGFLSENVSFAKMCSEMGINYIGPSYELIELMGNKSKAKETMKKAVSGGGGKGIRIANSEEELIRYYDVIRAEAKSAFNDDSIYIEKYIKNPRHIEIQVIADKHGNVAHLGDRDCTVQRKNQKMLEESPSDYIDEKLRQKMEKVSVKAIEKIGYTNAGTIEYLVDKEGNFYFMEMNTRLQVEHPVTEFVTGVDLVKEQINIASGKKLSKEVMNLHIKGHSIECRINAENPDKNFMPCPGKITGLHIPGGNGIRVDSAIYQDYIIPPNYDSMIAKLIVHGKDREECINKMKSALGEFVIEGVTTNIDFLYKILENPEFIKNDYDTSFIK